MDFMQARFNYVERWAQQHLARRSCPFCHHRGRWVVDPDSTWLEIAGAGAEQPVVEGSRHALLTARCAACGSLTIFNLGRATSSLSSMLGLSTRPG